MNRRGMFVTVAIVAAAGVGLVSFIRSRPMVDEHSAAVREIVNEAQRAYRGLPVAKWSDEDSIARSAIIQEVLPEFRFDVEAAATTGFAPAKGRLLDALAGFLQTAIIERNLEDYEHWRRSRGDRLRSMEDMNRSWYIEEDWVRDFDEACPPQLTVETAFERHWNAWEQKAGAGSVPVGIARSPDALECAVAIVTSLAGDRRPVLTGALGRAGWTGGQGGTARLWWTNDRSGQFLLQTYGRVLCAEVGVVLEYQNGARHPLVTTWVCDPEDGGWRLEFVCVYNWDDRRSVRSMEY